MNAKVCARSVLRSVAVGGFSLLCSISSFASVALANTTVSISSLQPDWTAGGGVWSAYYAPDSQASPGTSPGSTAVFDGRQAGIIKAGITPESSGANAGHYQDEGLLAFQVNNVDLATFAGQTLTYDVENQTGVNPVWVRIRLTDTNQSEYQFIPASYGTGSWQTINAAAGQWQLMDSNGNGTGSPMSLADVAAANPGVGVDRVYLTLGIGDSYNVSAGVGTVAWVSSVTIDTVTYQFVAPNLAITAPSSIAMSTSSLVAETGGVPSSNAAVDAATVGVTPLVVGLKNTGGAASPSARINPIGDTSGHIQYWAKDTSNNWYDINVTGWGPIAGFAVPAGYDASTNVYVLADAIGDYASTINFADASSPTTVLASSVGTIHIVDLAALKSAIAAAQSTVAGATVGTAIGNYGQTAVDTLNAAITAAQAKLTDATSQADVDTAVTTLTTAVATFNASVVSLSLPTVTSSSSVSATVVSPTQASASVGGINVTVDIPASTVITGNLSWTGTIEPPTATTATVAVTGFTTTVTSAIAVGSGDSDLTFSQPVRLSFAGQAGTHVGWYNHAGTFTEITNTCDADAVSTTVNSGAAFADGSSCKMAVGSDLVVWTKHFSVFTTYTQAATPVQSSGGGGGVAGLYGQVSNGYGGYVAATANIPANVATTPVSQQGEVLGAAAYNFTKPLQFGSRGADVTALQQMLTLEGVYKGPVTGYFGVLTRAGVKAYQAKYHIAQVGTVGPLTRAQLNLGVMPTSTSAQ